MIEWGEPFDELRGDRESRLALAGLPRVQDPRDTCTIHLMLACLTEHSGCSDSRGAIARMLGSTSEDQSGSFGRLQCIPDP